MTYKQNIIKERHAGKQMEMVCTAYTIGYWMAGF